MGTVKDFTYIEYNKFIQILKDAGYIFTSFDNTEIIEPFILLRHDIDLDLKKAVIMSNIEHEMGVRATYFIMLRNIFYNTFSKSGMESINKIIENGHNIGLHFDCSVYPKEFTIENYKMSCKKELQIFENWFDIYINVVSYHRPNNFIFDNNGNISGKYYNTNEHYFTTISKYYSDSRGKWKYGYPLDGEQFKQKKPLHITIHPIWWNEKHTTPYNSLLKFIEEDDYNFKTSLSKNCEVWK